MAVNLIYVLFEEFEHALEYYDKKINVPTSDYQVIEMCT